MMGRGAGVNFTHSSTQSLLLYQQAIYYSYLDVLVGSPHPREVALCHVAPRARLVAEPREAHRLRVIHVAGAAAAGELVGVFARDQGPRGAAAGR